MNWRSIRRKIALWIFPEGERQREIRVKIKRKWDENTFTIPIRIWDADSVEVELTLAGEPRIDEREYERWADEIMDDLELDR